MSPRREIGAFGATLALLVGGFFAEVLVGGKVLSPADVLLASASFREVAGPEYEPLNRLLIDPVIQFQPWLEFNRRAIRAGRLPTWNDLAGCGAPHLANGQAAVFDPFHLIAYLGTLPGALGWMAAARLWFAGLGMFLLAKGWGLGPWGRWFAGLAFPFSGFVIAWLLFPVTNVAVWMPWVFLATARLWDRADPRAVAWLALATGGAVLGGHVQTAAHVLLAAASFAGWLAWRDPGRRGKLVAWALGVTLGLGIASVEIFPLASYLTRSPVWGDRAAERVAPWRLARPRWLDLACTAAPSLYGSQRRGEPNLARALGVHNQNESSGGFAGLATLALAGAPGLVEPATAADRRVPGGLGGVRPAGRVPVPAGGQPAPGLAGPGRDRQPADDALDLVRAGRARRDRPRPGRRGPAVAGLGGLGPGLPGRPRWLWGARRRRWAGSSRRSGPGPLAHYARMAAATPGADPAAYRDRAERQAREAVAFVPRYLAWLAAQGLAMAGLVAGLRRGTIPDRWGRLALLALVMVDLLGFARGLNPAIAPALDRPEVAVIARLRAEVGVSGRSDRPGGGAAAEHLDAVRPGRRPELRLGRAGPGASTGSGRCTTRRSSPGPAGGRSPGTGSRPTATAWREAGVRAVVAATPPPAGLGRSERVGAAWIAWLPARPLVEAVGPGSGVEVAGVPGRIQARVIAPQGAELIVRQVADPGWRATLDGRPLAIDRHRGAFLSARVPRGTHEIQFIHDPIEVRLGLAGSLGSLALAVFGLTRFGTFRFTRSVGPTLGRIQALGLRSTS